MSQKKKGKRPTVGNRPPKTHENAGGIELRFDDQGEFDELYVRSAQIHIERMSDDHWWMSVTCGQHSVMLDLHSKALIHPLAQWSCHSHEVTAARPDPQEDR